MAKAINKGTCQWCNRVQLKENEMTRNEAAYAIRAIDYSRRVLVDRIHTIERKKSWTLSQKAMALAEHRFNLDQLVKLRESLGTEHNL